MQSMKTVVQRALALLWLATFIAVISYWLWGFLHQMAPAYDGVHALESPLLLFGIVASIFLFKGANWARISMGCVAIVFAIGTFFWEIMPQDWGMRWDKSGDDAAFVLSLITAVLLLFPRARFVPAKLK
jgi:uncharacterized membrane protein